MTCKYLNGFNCSLRKDSCLGYYKTENGEGLDELTIRRMECFDGSSYLDGLLLQNQLQRGFRWEE